MPRFLIGMASGLFEFDTQTDHAPRVLLPGVQALSLAIDPGCPQRIFCATYNRGLWRSEDNGRTWFPVGTPQNFQGPAMAGAIGPRETTFVSLSARPDSDGRHAVWVGTEMSALYRSNDHGDTFELASPLDLPSRKDWAFPPRPETHHVHRIEHDAEGGIHVAIEFGAMLRSRDDGSTFEDRLPDSPLDTHVLLTHPLAPRRLYAALGDAMLKPGHSFAESRDNGETWRYLGQGLEAMPYLYGVAVDSADPDDMLVAASKSPRTAHVEGGASIFRRKDDTWAEDAEGFPSAGSLVPVLLADPYQSQRWFALSDYGLFVKGRDAPGWTPMTAPTEWHGIHPMSLVVLPE
jgi:hypothetical protein